MNRLWVRFSIVFSLMVLAGAFIVALTGIVLGRVEQNYRRQLINNSINYEDRQNNRMEDMMKNLSGELTNAYKNGHNRAEIVRLLIRRQTFFNRQVDIRLAFFLADTDKQVIYHVQKRQIGKQLDQIEPIQVIPIEIGGQIVAYLGRGTIFTRNSVPPSAFPIDPDKPSDFVTLMVRVLVTVAVLVGISGMMFGIFMSRSLTAPLNDLAEAAKAIGSHNLSQRVEPKGSDEMIAVACAFNEMAGDLEQAESLRRNLLADVTHELRTPLSVLQGNLRAILDGVFPCNDEEVARLYDQSRFLSRMVNDLHKLAQAEAKQLPLTTHKTDLALLVKHTADSFRPGAEAEGVTLSTKISADLPLVEVDSARITQVLNNLLVNALRYTPARGSITISVISTSNAIHLTVSDTGKGISSEQLPHIFDRFYRTDPNRSRNSGGTGLGLAICRAIIEAHGGQIEAKSDGETGQGTTFNIYLPVSHPKSSQFTVNN